MKKKFALLLILLFILCTGCSDKPVGISVSDNFPIELSDFESMLDEIGMDYTHAEIYEGDVSYGYTCFELFRDELKTKNYFFTTIVSTPTHDTRYAGASIVSDEPYKEHVCPLDDNSEMIILATKMLGVFVDDDVVYKQFMKEFPDKNTEMKFYGVSYSPNAYEEYIWKKEIGGVDCKVKLEKLNRDGAEPAITTIDFSYTINK